MPDIRTALLIVDIQNDYFPGGAMENVGSVSYTHLTLPTILRV